MFCRIFRFSISSAIDSGRLPKVTENHLKKCEKCRDFYHLCSQLEKKLTADTSAQICIAPEGLKERILDNINSAEDGNFSTIPFFSIRPIAIAAVAAIVIFVGVFFFTVRINEQRPLDQTENGILANNFAELITAGTGWTYTNNMLEKPLIAEIQNIVYNTASAGRFLVSCLPIDSIPELSDKEDEEIN